MPAKQGESLGQYDAGIRSAVAPTLDTALPYVTRGLYVGASGFNMGTTITSDWVNLSFTSSALLVVICDVTSGNEELATGVANVAFWGVTGATYNQANPTGYTGSGTAGFVPGFNLIETQASGGGATDGRASQSGTLVATTLFRERLSGLLEPVRELWKPKRPRVLVPGFAV